MSNKPNPDSAHSERTENFQKGGSGEVNARHPEVSAAWILGTCTVLSAVVGLGVSWISSGSFLERQIEEHKTHLTELQNRAASVSSELKGLEDKLQIQSELAKTIQNSLQLETFSGSFTVQSNTAAYQLTDEDNSVRQILSYQDAQGSGWDESKSAYVVPRDGLYSIHLSYWVENHVASDTWLSLQQNGNDLFSIRTTGNDKGRKFAHGVRTFDLKKGDRITARFGRDQGGGVENVWEYRIDGYSIPRLTSTQ